MEEKKIIHLNVLCESLDLALITLQAFDNFSYNRFLEELTKNKDCNDLLLTLSRLRLINQINKLYKEENPKNFSFSKSLENFEFSRKKIKKILSILSKTLNTPFCKQKFDFIYFYFLLECSIFAMKTKIYKIKTFSTYSFWISEYKKRFSFFNAKLTPKLYSCPKTVYLFLLHSQTIRGLKYLDYYRCLT